MLALGSHCTLGFILQYLELTTLNTCSPFFNVNSMYLHSLNARGMDSNIYTYVSVHGRGVVSLYIFPGPTIFYCPLDFCNITFANVETRIELT